MPESQKEIYYLFADNEQAAASSPQLEAFKAKGYEVLFCTDPVDEWIMTDLPDYKEKKFRMIGNGDIDLDTEDEKKAKEEQRKADAEENKDLLAVIKEKLGDKVKEVRLSNRLTESACCLVGDEGAYGAAMERMMKSITPDMPPSKRILEINASHPLIVSMRKLVAKDAKNAKLDEYASMLYGEALLTAQMPLEDPLAFAKAVSALLVKDSEAEVERL